MEAVTDDERSAIEKDLMSLGLKRKLNFRGYSFIRSRVGQKEAHVHARKPRGDTIIEQSR
jgi:hypothetical protein